MNPRDLPIYSLAAELSRTIRAGGRRILIQAPTGSGKSTQVPQIILEAGLLKEGQRMAILQPRRMAARMLAARVAHERGQSLGGDVGYQIRFEDRAGQKINFVTEGILLRRYLDDPLLKDYGVLIFDEFHERHLYSDITLACAHRLQQTERPDMVIIVMSATLDTAAVEKYLMPCTALRSEGRIFPVTVGYLDRTPNDDKVPLWELAADETDRLLREMPDGDALVFMPGAYEIQRTISALQTRPKSRSCAIFPLHGELASADQDAAVAPSTRRKIIVATNVAETSLTIEGVRVVVDSGLARVARFDPYRGINTLLIERISKASAEQRAGRGGRTAPGFCLRLWTARDDQERALREVPEVRRVDLAEMLLTLKAAGFVDAGTFPWFEPPEPKALSRAEMLLADLGAVEEGSGGRLTPLGRRMAAFPLHPRFSRMLIAAGDYRCVRPVARVAALTQERSLLLRRPGDLAQEHRDRTFGEDHESDYSLLIRAWQEADAHDYNLDYCRKLGVHAATARRVGHLAEYFVTIARSQGLPVESQPPPDDALRRCLLAGFADQVARRVDGGTLRCELVHGRTGVLDRESVTRHGSFLVAGEVHEIEHHAGSRDSLQVRLSLATVIDPAWLKELFPADIHEASEVILDPESRRVVARNICRFRDLILETRRTDAPDESKAASLLADEVIKGRASLKHWDQSVEQWIVRINCVRQWCPEAELPIIDEAARRSIIEHVCHGAFSVKEIKDRPVLPVIQGWISRGQQALVERYAPERLALPNGHRVKVVYDEKMPPYVAARIQDIYEWQSNPRIAEGRVMVTIRVLAPNQRPVQITSDLANFWRDHYPKVKKELQRKYPKHVWR